MTAMTHSSHMSPHFYLQRLRVQQLRKFDQLELADLAPGLNVFAGPNGAGKSSLVRALRAAFLERYGSNSAQDLQPISDSGATPTVELEFVLHGQPYQLSKSFLKKKRCDLAGSQGQWSGQEAEDHLAEALGFAFAPKGTKADYWGVPGLLWVEQGAHTEAFKNSVQHASRHLHAALHSTQGTEHAAPSSSDPAGALAATSGDALIAQLQQQLGQYLGKSGKPVGTYAQLLTHIEEGQAQLQALAQRMQEYRSQVDTLQNLLQEQREDEQQRPSEAWQQQLQHAREQLQQWQAQQQAYAQGQQQLQQYQSRLQLLLQTLEQHQGNTRQLQQRAQALQQAKAQLEQAEQQLHTQQQRWQQIQEAYSQIQAQWQQVQARQQQAQLAASLQARFTALHQQYTETQERYRHAQTQLQKVQQLRQALSALSVEKSDIVQLSKLEQAVLKASLQHQAAATQLQFDLPGDQRVQWRIDAPHGAMQGQAQGQLHGQGQVALDAPTTLELPGGGVLRITPGGQEVAHAAQALQQATAQLKAYLQRLQVDSVAAALEQWEARQQHQQALQLALQALQLHAPQGVEVLADELTQLQQLVQQLQEQLVRYAPPQTAQQDASTLTPEQLQQQALELEQQWQRTQADWQLARQQHALAQQHCQAAQREHDALAQQLQHPEVVATAQRIQQEAVLLQAQVEQLQQQLQTQATTLAQAPGAMAAQDIERLERSIAVHTQQVQQRKERIAALHASLDAVGSSNLEETHATLAATVAQQQRQAEHMQRHAQALQLLVQRLTQARAAAVQRLQAPLAQRMQHYVQLLQPGATLELDAQLLPQRILLPHAEAGAGPDAQAQRLAGWVDLLSYGSQEQLGIVSRLAYADVLRQAGHPTLLILDDALVHSDAQRLAQMKRALFDAAQRHQVLLFTCRGQDWRDAGVEVRSL